MKPLNGCELNCFLCTFKFTHTHTHLLFCIFSVVDSHSLYFGLSLCQSGPPSVPRPEGEPKGLQLGYSERWSAHSGRFEDGVVFYRARGGLLDHTTYHMYAVHFVHT